MKRSRLPASSHLHVVLFGQPLQAIGLTYPHTLTAWAVAILLFNLFLILQFSLFDPPYCCKSERVNFMLKTPLMLLHHLYDKI